MRIVGEHDEEVFIVLARNHRVEPVDASGKKCHPLILDRSAIQSEYTKIQKIPRFHQLGENNALKFGEKKPFTGFTHNGQRLESRPSPRSELAFEE